MNEEKLLAEAKRRYPIGTVMKCLKDGEQGIIISEPKYNWDGNIYSEYRNSTQYQFIHLNGNNKWAEIISLPSEYLVGTSVKVVLDSMNASQFNTKDCPYNGVYSIKLWRNEIFTICGEPKLYKGYGDEYQKCYPLAHNEKLVGYVYSKGIVPYKEKFTLLEKWCIETINQEVVDYCNEYGKMPPYSIAKDVYAHFPNYNGLTTCAEVKPGFTLITFEQFKKYVLNINETKNSVMKTFPITRTQFQYIYDVACSEWKSKINTMVQEKLGTFGTSCELSYEVVDSMFKAATVTQTEVLVKIFPDYSADKSIDLKEKGDGILFTRSSSCDGMINVRSGGDYNGKAFYLSAKFKWELKEDDCGDLCLIPTHK